MLLRTLARHFKRHKSHATPQQIRAARPPKASSRPPPRKASSAPQTRPDSAPYDHTTRNSSRDSPAEPSKPSKGFGRTFFWFFNGILLSHLFVTHVASIHFAAGASMLPTINVSGDAILISYLHRRGHGVKRGDIVSFVHPMHVRQRAMKRVIGMPGDIVCRDTPPEGRESGGVGPNGEKEECWMVQVPQGHCWVVGDNLPWSRDSRMYGPIPLALIVGKAIARVGKDWKWLGDEFKEVEEEVEVT